MVGGGVVVTGGVGVSVVVVAGVVVTIGVDDSTLTLLLMVPNEPVQVIVRVSGS